MAVASCVALFVGKLESKDFMLLASMAFSFYFAMPTPPNQGIEGVK